MADRRTALLGAFMVVRPALDEAAGRAGRRRDRDRCRRAARPDAGRRRGAGGRGRARRSVSRVAEAVRTGRRGPDHPFPAVRLRHTRRRRFRDVRRRRCGVTGWGVIPSVRVRDMPSALRFYREVLGFDVERGGRRTRTARSSTVTRGSCSRPRRITTGTRTTRRSASGWEALPACPVHRGRRPRGAARPHRGRRGPGRRPARRPPVGSARVHGRGPRGQLADVLAGRRCELSVSSLAAR